jgi:hypothetical protein
MSNLSEFLDEINNVNSSGVKLVGAAVGTIADFAGGIGAVTDAIGLISSILSPDQTGQLLQDIRDELRAGLEGLGLQNKADEILREWDNTDDITRDAEGIYLTLLATVTAGVGTDEIVRQINVCATALNGLSFTRHAEQWLVDHVDQVYFGHLGDTVYTPGGPASSVFTFIPGTADRDTPFLEGMFSSEDMTFTNLFDPGADQNGDVFSYAYTLPAYMQLVMIFLATAATLDPEFARPDKYANVIRLASADLQALHRKILAGIVNVAPPDADSLIIPFPFTRDDPFVSYANQRSSGRYGDTFWFQGWGTQDGLIVDTSFPFGAVNLYSGAFSVQGYPVLDIPFNVFPNAQAPGTAPPSAGDDFFIRPVSKYLLRSLIRRKEVYDAIGLHDVWKTINRLNNLVGDPPMPPSFGDWSLREIFSVLGVPRNLFIEPPLSIGKLGLYLAGSTPFFPVPRRPFSLRQIVDGIPPAAPFAG